MSFQISELTLYSIDGQWRSIEFAPGRLNIITGRSKTGKSALLWIIDYCLGAGTSRIPAGPAQTAVSWYGLHLTSKHGNAFVARRSPRSPNGNATDVYLDIGDEVVRPAPSDLQPTTNVNGLIPLLSEFAGIGINSQAEQSQRDDYAATVRHALFFCMLDQNEIQDKRHLFHRQNESYVFYAIRDVLPYFLGAVPEDYVSTSEKLRKLRRNLKQLEQRKTETDAILGTDFSRARELFEEARSSGLLAQDESPPKERAQMVERLREAAILDEQKRVSVAPSFEDDYAKLHAERRRLFTEYRKIQREVESTENLLDTELAFSRESEEQVSRMRSIGLLRAQHEDAPPCPVCGQEPSHITETLRELQSDIEQVDQKVAEVRASSPGLESHAVQLKERKEALKAEIHNNQTKIEAVRRRDDSSTGEWDTLSTQAIVSGRISLLLENLPTEGAATDLEDRIEELRLSIQKMSAYLSDEEIEAKLDSILSVISRRLTKLAQQLELEHSDSPIRLERKKLRIVADTKDGAIPLEKMGSGENWVGYHIATSLVLHQWFTEHLRPVPKFLIFDQPSQVYYPADFKEESPDMPEDVDQLSLRRLFRTILTWIDTMDDPPQIIISEHADLEDEWFQSAVIERWRHNVESQLVPNSWPQWDS